MQLVASVAVLAVLVATAYWMGRLGEQHIDQQAPEEQVLVRRRIHRMRVALALGMLLILVIVVTAWFVTA